MPYTASLLIYMTCEFKSNYIISNVIIMQIANLIANLYNNLTALKSGKYYLIPHVTAKTVQRLIRYKSVPTSFK